MNKNIIITGASRGIGYELAKIHLQNGNNVLAISRNEQKLRELAQFADKSQYKYIAIDLSNYKELDKCLDEISDWQNIDILYNNAGYLVNKPFAELTETDIDTSLAVNYKAPLRLIQLFLYKMNANTHIVNITTMGAIQGSMKFPGLAAYSSSKTGIITLTELLAEEFNESQPKINNIALGAVQTEMLEEAFPGYKAPITAKEISEYLYKFGIEGHHYQNGKTIQLSTSTP
ncbi:MAG: SDR family NAD(P)-dependent oxidoreductase [Moheibacter sp.]